MKTWEMIKKLTENPKLIFTNNKPLGNGIGSNTVKIIRSRLVWVDKNGNEWNNFGICENNFAYEWELVKESVPFMEAVKAYSEGKTIRCEINGHVIVYKPFYGMPKIPNGNAITAHQILDGAWFIEI